MYTNKQENQNGVSVGVYKVNPAPVIQLSHRVLARELAVPLPIAVNTPWQLRWPMWLGLGATWERMVRNFRLWPGLALAMVRIWGMN